MKCALCNAVVLVEQTKATDTKIIRKRKCFNNHIFYTEEVAVTEPRLPRKKKSYERT